MCFSACNSCDNPPTSPGFLLIPLAFAALELKLHIVDGIRGPILATTLLLGDELLSEGIVIRFSADLVHHNFLLVIGDLVNNVLGTTSSKFQLIEGGDAVRVDGESGRIEELERNEGVREMTSSRQQRPQHIPGDRLQKGQRISNRREGQEAHHGCKIKVGRTMRLKFEAVPRIRLLGEA